MNFRAIATDRAGFWWGVLGLWTAVIFAAVPYANEVQAWIRTQLGEGALRAAMIAVVAVSAVAVMAFLLKRRGRWRLRGFLWMFGISAFTLIWMSQLRVAAEPVHLVEYGVLAVLAFRALSRHLRDGAVYPAAAALTALIGTFDELLQWLTPGRFWDLGDVGINAATGVLVQLLIRQGIRPAAGAGRPRPHSVRVALRLIAVEVLVLGLSLLNTPPRIEWYAARIPGLGYLGTGRSTRMVEYGHRYVDSEIGRFRSRFAPQELERADRERGAAAAAILARYRRPRHYHEFLLAYHPPHYPFLFEARTHLRYRDRLWARAGRARDDPAAQRRLATEAYRENLILERYFPNTLKHSDLVLTPAVRQAMAALHQPGDRFESEVSDWLLTGFREVQVRWGLLIALVWLVVADRWWSRWMER